MPGVVTAIRTQIIRVPYPEPPRFRADVPEVQEFLIVHVDASDGLSGLGFLQPLDGGLKTLQCCVHEMLEPVVLGRDYADVEGAWQAMWDATYIQGRMGITVMAASAIDIALWDLAGKAAGKPLFELWGGTNDPIPTYGSGCFRGLGQQGMIDKARAFVEQGFPAIKMQVAHLHDDDQDVANVHAMRNALGPDIHVMVDVNQGWTVQQAIRAGTRLQEADIYWLEEPVIAHDFEGYRAIAEALDIRVVGGENHFTRHDLKPFFDVPCVPILQPDVMRGGLTELRRIAHLAHERGILIAPHLFPELMTHLLASIPNASWLEYMGWHDDLWEEPVTVDNGSMRPPDRPGHGLSFKPQLLNG